MLKYKKVKTLMHEKNISKKDATDALRRNKWDLEAARKEYNIPETLDAITATIEAFMDMMNEVPKGMIKTIEALVNILFLEEET